MVSTVEKSKLSEEEVVRVVEDGEGEEESNASSWADFGDSGFFRGLKSHDMLDRPDVVLASKIVCLYAMEAVDGTIDSDGPVDLRAR